jgi:MFS family permease
LNASVQHNPTRLSSTTLAALLLSAAQAPLGSTMIAVALPAISHALHRDLALCTSALVTSYLIVNIIGQSPGGKLGDALGHTRTLRLGMAVQALGGIIGLCASQLGALVLSRCTLALGSALVVPATMALLRMQVAPERHGRVFGLVGATMSLSAAIGPPLGGELVGHFGWRAIFFVGLPLLGVAAVLLGVTPEPAHSTERTIGMHELARGFDWAGTVMLALALAALVIGGRRAGIERLLYCAAFVVTGVAFVLWELRCKSPVLDPRLFTKARFTAGSTLIALSNFAMYGLLFALPQFFQQVRGASSKDAGRVMFVMMLAMFVTSPFGGRLNDRLGARATALLGLVPTLCALLWLRQLDMLLVPADAAPALILLGIGTGLSNAPAQVCALSSVPSAQSGMAAGATSTMRYLGGVLSILMLSTWLDKQTGVGPYLMVTTAFCISASLAVLVCLWLPGVEPTEPN